MQLSNHINGEPIYVLFENNDFYLIQNDDGFKGLICKNHSNREIIWRQEDIDRLYCKKCNAHYHYDILRVAEDLLEGGKTESETIKILHKIIC